MNNLMETYIYSFYGIFALLLMVFIQEIVASFVHAKQEGAVPGKVSSNLDHHSFEFRTHRTFMNSLENVPFMVFLVLLSIFTGLGATTLVWVVWVYVFGRLMHMVLYYKIATNKNPSPRSYFFMIASFAHMALFVLLGVHLCSM